MYKNVVLVEMTHTGVPTMYFSIDREENVGRETRGQCNVSLGGTIKREAEIYE